MNKRLKELASFVPKNTIVSDIGCDHAQLGKFLIKEKITKKVISIDINEKIIKKLKSTESKMDFRLGNGFEPLENNEIDTVVISGLGGITINKICSNKKIKYANTLIISPNTDIFSVRKKITKMDFFISDESIINDRGKTYEIIVFKKGKKKYSYKQLLFGPKLLEEKNEIFLKKYKKEMRTILSYYNSIKFGLQKIKLKIKINAISKAIKK